MTDTWYSKAEIDARNSGVFYVSDYGALGNGGVATDVATNSTNTFTSATISANASVGMWVMINGGRGTSDTAAIGTITGISGTSVTISTTVSGLPINATASSLNAVYGTDDTTAINNCVAAASSYAQSHNYSCEIRFEDRVYIVAGLTQTTNTNETYNATIPIPYPTGNNGRKLVITFKGPTRVDHILYWESTVPNLAGTSIVCMKTAPSSISGTYGPQSVFGAPTPNSGLDGLDTGDPNFINHKPIFENIQVIVPVFTNLTAYDFTYSSGVRVDGCAAMAFAQSVVGNGVTLLNVYSSFGAGQGTGIRLPTAGNNADNYIPNFAVEGFNTGMLCPSEHVLIDVYKAMYTGVALEVASSTSGHGLTIGHVTAEAYQGGILYQGGISNIAPIHIGSWSTEVVPSAYDISDSGNNLYGDINWYSTLGAGRDPIITGAANLKIINQGKGIGNATAPSVPATTVAHQNTFWRDAAVSIKGGTVTVVAVDGATVATATNTTVIVPSGKNITLTYSSAPTWVWTLL